MEELIAIIFTCAVTIAFLHVVETFASVYLQKIEHNGSGLPTESEMSGLRREIWAGFEKKSFLDYDGNAIEPENIGAGVVEVDEAGRFRRYYFVRKDQVRTHEK